jgi:hypothetical protein
MADDIKNILDNLYPDKVKAGRNTRTKEEDDRTSERRGLLVETLEDTSRKSSGYSGRYDSDKPVETPEPKDVNPYESVDTISYAKYTEQGDVLKNASEWPIKQEPTAVEKIYTSGMKGGKDIVEGTYKKLAEPKNVVRVEYNKAGKLVMETDEKGKPITHTTSKHFGEGSTAWKVAKATADPIGVAMTTIGGFSDAKLKLEAMKYGVLPSEFDDMTQTQKMALLTDIGKLKKSEAETKYVAAGALKRESESEAEASKTRIRDTPVVPPGGRKLVQFGWKEGSFGQEPTYVNASGVHGQMRSQYIPGRMSGVSTALANSRLEIAKMKSRVLGGAGREYGRSDIIGSMPRQAPQSIISKLAGTRSNPTVGQFRQGPNVLQKLSTTRRR